MRDEHYTSFMHLYYSTLSANIQKLGSDPEQLFSWHNFQAQLKEFGVYALVICPIIIQLRLATSDDCTDLDAVSGVDAEDFDVITGFTEERQMIYNRTVNELVDDLIELEYLL